MRIQKHELRDFVRSLDEPTDQPAAAIKPRDDSFMKNVAEQAFTTLREAEREFLLNLDHDSITKMHNPGDSPKCHPVAHLRYHLQVLLALKGIQPCVPFVSPKETGTVVMNAMVLRCLVPLMEQLDLESYGFRLICRLLPLFFLSTLFFSKRKAGPKKKHFCPRHPESIPS